MAIDISQYTIEQNVPIPARKSSGLKALAKKMQPSESVVMSSYSRAHSLRNRIYESGHKATVQRINVETNPRTRDYRVWKLGEKK